MPTIIKTFTSSQGGVKNYLSTRSSSFSGWTNVGTGATGSTTTTAAELPELSVGTALKVTNGGSGSGYVESDFFQVDASDLGKLLGLTYNLETSSSPAYAANDFQIQVWDATTSGGTYAQNTTLNVANIPSSPTGGTMQLSFSQNPSRPFTRIRIVRVAGLANSWASFSSITVTSATGGQSAAISEWQSYTPTVGGYAASAVSGRYRRVGDSMQLRVLTTLSSFTSGSFTITTPAGFTVNASAFPNNATNVMYGSASYFDFSLNVAYAGIPYLAGANTISVYGPNQTAWAGGTVPVAIGAGDTVSIEMTIPIAEWAGNGTVNLGAGAQVEYASNNGTWNGTDSTSFVYGPAGVQMGGNLSSAVRKRVRFQYPIQADDMLIVELSSDGTVWTPASNTSGSAASVYGGGYTTIASGITAGISLERVNSTDVDVLFGQYRDAITADGTSATNWGTIYRWRVRKAKASAPVGFGRATDTDTGLMLRGRFQTKTLAANETMTATETNFSGLTFNNLTVGRTYRVTGQLWAEIVTNLQPLSILFRDGNGGTIVGQEQLNGSAGTNVSIGVSFIYTATNSTLQTSKTGAGSASAILAGNGTRARSYLQIEEVDITTTSAWT